MKRSKTVALALLGSAAFGLAACTEEKTEAAAFSDLESCVEAASAGGWFTKQDCEETFADAAKLHDETAPRYESREVCEAEHGAGACGDQVSNNGGGGGGFFMPMMMGYLIGQALGGGRPISQPMVRTAGGGFASPDGNTKISSLNSSGTINSSAFNKAPVTKGLAPMTQAQAKARGGFGQSSTRGVGG